MNSGLLRVLSISDQLWSILDAETLAALSTIYLEHIENLNNQPKQTISSFNNGWDIPRDHGKGVFLHTVKGGVDKGAEKLARTASCQG